jgi:hypothetical protein
MIKRRHALLFLGLGAELVTGSTVKEIKLTRS